MTTTESLTHIRHKLQRHAEIFPTFAWRRVYDYCESFHTTSPGYLGKLARMTAARINRQFRKRRALDRLVESQD